MAKLNYQELGRQRHLSTQNVVNTPDSNIKKSFSVPRRDLMPYGKYRNYHWADIPTDYLMWVVKTIQDRTIFQAARTELNRRKGPLPSPAVDDGGHMSQKSSSHDSVNRGRQTQPKR